MEFLGYPLIFWVTAVLAVILVGIAKSGFGGGAGVIATPLMALTIPVADAAAILLPLLLIIDVFSLWHYRSDWDRPTVRATLPGAIIGIVIGGLFFSAMADQERALKVAIGIIAIGFVIWQLGKNAIFKLPQNGIPTWTGWPLGALAGFSSTLAHVGGPPFLIYLLPQGLPQKIFVGTSVVFFFVVNLTKLIPYALLGLLTVGNLKIVVVLAPLAYLGVVLGIWLNKRFSPLWFNRLVYILLILTAFQLLIGDSFLRILLQG